MMHEGSYLGRRYKNKTTKTTTLPGYEHCASASASAGQLLMLVPAAMLVQLG